jgi:hypothetical protein
LRAAAEEESDQGRGEARRIHGVWSYRLDSGRVGEYIATRREIKHRDVEHAGDRLQDGQRPRHSWRPVDVMSPKPTVLIVVKLK